MIDCMILLGKDNCLPDMFEGKEVPLLKYQDLWDAAQFVPVPAR
jgi:hypothetical protein